jgi:hypothetical protein
MMPMWLFRLWDKEKRTPLNLAPKHMAEIVALLRDDRAHEFGKWDWLPTADYAQRFGAWEVMLEGAWREFVNADPAPWPDNFKYPIRNFLDNSLSYIVRVLSRVKVKQDFNNYAAERVNNVDDGNLDWLKWASQVVDKCQGWHATHGYSDDE